MAGPGVSTAGGGSGRWSRAAGLDSSDRSGDKRPLLMVLALLVLFFVLSAIPLGDQLFGLTLLKQPSDYVVVALAILAWVLLVNLFWWAAFWWGWWLGERTPEAVSPFPPFEPWVQHVVLWPLSQAAIVVALLAVALLTPQGRAFSQSILQFFRPAEDTTSPLQPSLVVTDEPDPSAPTAEPPVPLISVAEAQVQAGFGIAELPFVPDGLNYLGARVYGGAVHIEYQTADYDGHLIIKESQQGFVESDWDSVPAEEVVPVKIGELDGESTQGAFVVYAGGTVGTWNPDAPILRLRWAQDGLWIEMTKHGNGEATEYLDQAGLIELAESLALKP